ncbi:unnamed protein product [Vicia faba]|uniref:Uncharacterized protein n=1 Tax=Vicia faba TaxID=3906 RepID=A0AAV1AKA7_VICFA|nr:unnamed protein product [Vicia faba]
MIQRDMHLQEIHTTSTFFTRIRDTLLPLNLHGSLIDQVTHLVRIMARKNQSLAYTQSNISYSQASISVTHRGLESLRLENASLTQRLANCTATNLEVASYSFKNALCDTVGELT